MTSSKLHENPYRGSQQDFLEHYIENKEKRAKYPEFIGPTNFPPISTEEPKQAQQTLQTAGSFTNYILNPVNNKKYRLNTLDGKNTLKLYIKAFNNLK